MTSELVWLAAYYHFPSTYSCRMPLSSKSVTLATPGPAPSTVRLALIRAGCEIFDGSKVREELYPLIRAANIRIRPPERVAISQQVLQGYKGRQGQTSSAASMVNSLLHREVAQAEGALTVYVQVPDTSVDCFCESLMTIGYWGQTDSLATCLAVEKAIPNQNECLLPLRLIQGREPLGAFFTCVLADFRHSELAWEEVIPHAGAGEGEPPLYLEVYVWPMRLVKRSVGNKLLVRQPFSMQPH